MAVKKNFRVGTTIGLVSLVCESYEQSVYIYLVCESSEQSVYIYLVCESYEQSVYISSL